MADYKYGQPIFLDTITTELASTGVTDYHGIRKEMSRRAMKSINANGAENSAIDRVNGMKEEWGTGVSTRVLIYNASGAVLTYRSKEDSSGYWSKYGPTSRLEVGEWGVCFHHKTSGSATGSCAAVGFDIHGYASEVLLVAFTTPWSGRNSACCKVMEKGNFSRTPWSTMHDWSDDAPDTGKNDYGCLRTEYTVDQASSPVLTVKLYRNDV